MKCYDCDKKVAKGIFRCDSCYKREIVEKKLKRRIPLNEWEKMKLSWYRDEKKWHDNISRRKNIQVNGKQVSVLTNHKGKILKEMPKPRPVKAKRLNVAYNPQKI